jgi:parallel beta-helix repeat protein/putative cofactor-binding repeat protein
MQLVLENAQNSVITQNTFLNGGVALTLTGSSENVIERNLIHRPSETGIEVRDGSDANIIADNIIDGAEALETNGGGVFLHGVRSNRITHNLIQNTAGFGVGISNWDDATVNVANIVEYNLIRDTALTATDSGAIYILGRSGVDTQVVITGNVIDGVGVAGRHVVGIYLDDSTNGATVTGNLVRRAGSYAVQIHGGSDNLVENNLFDLGKDRTAAVLFQAAPADTNPLNAQTGNSVVRNVILSASEYPKLFDWIDGGSPHIAQNLYANATAAIIPQSSPVADVQPVIADAAIARDGDRSDYAAAQSAAKKIGFRQIDLSSAGPRGW